MPKSLGSRVILEHGPITNVLAALELIDQIRIAIICKRTYNITVVHNTLAVKLPIDTLCDFPGLKIPSDAFVCKRIEATIDGIFGEFFGIVCRQTDQPDGYGVFRIFDWVHCGQFKDGKFLEGRIVSINKVERLLKLTNKKCLADGSVIEKVELFSKQKVKGDIFELFTRQGVKRCILKDGQKIGAIIPRLNRVNDAHNWLSMQPNPLRYSDEYAERFGEVNEYN
jgi:hypothetical protein